MKALSERIADDLEMLLYSDAFLQRVNVRESRRGVSANDIATALAAFAPRPGYSGPGYRGNAVIVFEPLRTVDKPDAVGPRWNWDIVLRCLENPRDTRGKDADGNFLGISAELLSEYVEQLCHQYVLFHGATLVSKGADLLEFEDVPWRGYDVKLGFLTQGNSGPARTAIALLKGTAAAATIDCADPDAQVYYTTDDTFPAPTAFNPASIPYAGSFSVPVGTRVRAAAFNPTKLASLTDSKVYRA